MLTDIGVNLTHPQFRDDLAEVVERARAAAVTRMLITATDLVQTAAAIDLCAAGPGLWCTAGVHPHDAKDVAPNWQAQLAELATHPSVKAIGETGLDFHRNFSPPEIQKAAFNTQLELATQLGKPVFVHDRDTEGAVADSLAKHTLTGVVVHCFTGSRKDLLGYLDAGYYIGITGWVCDRRRGAALRELIPLIPLERLLVETDAPFLRPHNAPNGSRRNEPALLPYVVDQLAQLYGCAAEHVATNTHRNAARLFQLPD